MSKNFYFKNSSRKRIPRCVSIFFLVFVFVFGLDFGFIKIFNKKYHAFFKYLSVTIFMILFLCLFISVTYNWHPYTLVLYGMTFTVFSIHGLILYTAKYNLYDFMMDIYKIQNEIYNKEYRFLSCAVAYFAITLILNLLFFLLFCLEVMDIPKISYSMQLYVSCIQIFALDVVAIVQIFIYYYVYAPLNFLRKSMENASIDLLNVRKQFMMIADCCDKISDLYGKIVSILHVRRGICVEHFTSHFFHASVH